MTEKKSTERTTGGTFLGAAAMAGTIGGTYAAYKSGMFQPKGMTSSFSEASQSIRKPASFASKREYLNFLQMHAEFIKSPEGAELARQAWVKAAETVAPTARGVMSFTGKINELPYGDVYSAIEQTIQRNESHYMNKTASLFRRNFRAHKKHFDKLGKLPTFISPASPEITPRKVLIDELPEGIQGYISRMQNSLNASVSIQHYTRPGWEEHGLGTYLMNFHYKGGEFKANVPTTSGQFLSEGLTQSSMRIATNTELLDPSGNTIQRLTPTEYFLHNLEHKLIPDITTGRLQGRDVQKSVSSIYEQTIYSLEGIPNAEPAHLNKAWKDYARIHGQYVNMRFFDPTADADKMYRIPNEKEKIALQANRPDINPLPKHLAEGQYSYYNPRGWSMTPEALDFSRAPRQALREWKATPEAAKEIVKSKWTILETQQWRQDFGLYSAPWKKTVWVNPERHGDLLEKWGVDDGEHLLFDSKKRKQESEVFRQAWPANLKELEQNVAERIQRGDAFKPGEVLGTTIEGTPLVYNSNMKLKRIGTHSTTGKGNIFQLHYDEYSNHGASGKTFGISGAKGMQRIVPEDIAFGIQSNIAEATKNPYLAEGIEAVISMDELKKDRHKHNTQMIAALWEVMNNRVQNNGNVMSTLPSNRLSAPRKEHIDFTKFKNMSFAEIAEYHKKATVQQSKQLKIARKQSHLNYLNSLIDQQNQESFKPLSSWGNRLHQNPVQFANWFSKKATVGTNDFSREIFIKDLMTFAVKEKISPEEFGHAFGAVDYAMGTQWTSKLADELNLSDEYRSALFTGFTGGASQSNFAGKPEHIGAGGLGSVEPRVFEILKAGQYGKLGDDIAADMAQRLAATNPEKVSTYQSLTKSLQSINGEILPEEGAKIFDVSKMSQRFDSDVFQNFIEEGGGWLRTNKHGIKDIYVPGVKEASGMASFKSPGGDSFKGEIAALYHNYARQASRLHVDVGAISEEEIKEELGKLTTSLHAQQAPIGKGAGAFLKGQMLGSRYLTNLSSYYDYSPKDIWTTGISESYAIDMFEEMRSSGLYDADELDIMEQRFMKGEKIGGMIVRHPTISQYSAQPTNFELIKGATEPVMVTSSRLVDIGLQGEEGLTSIKLSSQIDLGADKDGDNIVAYMLSPKLDKEVNVQYSLGRTNSAERASMVQNMIRSQLIKAKGVGETGSVSMIEKMTADALKLGTADTWVGQLSTNFSEAKFAIGQNMSGPDAQNARFMFNFLEQVPISGKHLTTKGVIKGDIQNLFQALNSAKASKDYESFASSFEGILEHASPISKRLLTEDIAITGGADKLQELTGEAITHIPGINVRHTSKKIMEAIAATEDSGAMRTYREMAARKPVKPSGLRNYLRATADFLQNKKPNSGMMGQIVGAAMEAANYAASAGKKLIKNPKVGFGFAGALAIGAALSSPKETIGPSASLDTPSSNMNPTKAANRMTPDQIQPSQRLGNPSAPARIHSPRSLIAPGRESARMTVRAHSNQRINRGQLANALHGTTGSSVNINVRDNSQSINPHVFANKIL